MISCRHGFASALFLLLQSFAFVSAAPKPNIVLFLVDDMGWMDSTPYGSQYYETPRMEQFAKQAMRFTDAYSVPLCSPTRASILSGQYSARHRITSASGHQPPASPEASPYPDKAPRTSRFRYADSKNFLDPSMVTVAEVLRQAGYRTGHFGKWHLGLTPEYWPEQQGFETAWHCAPDPGPPSYFSPYGVETSGEPKGRRRVGTITDGPAGEYIVDRLTTEALKFLEAHQKEPFYLNLWQYGVHGPWGHKPEYTAEFAKKTDPRGQQRNPIMASMLRSVDESLGRVLDKLDELGLTQNTLFIFFSDNGGNAHSNTNEDGDLAKIKPGHPKYDFLSDWRKWAGGEPPTNNFPLREGKGRIYEGGQRVPLMVRWPGHVAPGSVNGTVVGAIDLYPTILAATGLEKPAGQVIDGKSLVPVLEQTGKLDREAYFTWFPHLIPACSVRSGDFKLIRRFEPHRDYPEVRELYNLRDDIGETKNLAKEMPDKVREMDALIDRFIQQTGALVPLPNPAYQDTEAKAALAPDAGLVAKMCTLAMQDGFLRVTVEPGKRRPFLGTAQVKHAGPLKLVLRARSQAGGAGQVQWKTAEQSDFPKEGQIVPFSLPGGGQWQDVEVNLPIAGPVQIIRLYLPAEQHPADVQLIRYTEPNAGKTVREWCFGK